MPAMGLLFGLLAGTLAVGAPLTSESPLRSLQYTPRSRSATVVWQKEVRAKLLDLLSINDLITGKKDIPFNPTEVRTWDMGEYVVKDLTLQSTPGRRMEIVLTLPKGASGRCPAVVCIGGHGSQRFTTYTKGQAFGELPANAKDSSPVYKGFAAELARRGYVTISTSVSQHKVCEEGRTLMGERLWDLMRCVDYLESLPQVDKSRIGCAGLSLGGEMVMWLAAVDERLQSAVSCGFLTTMDHIAKHGCPCWNFSGLRQLVDFADIYALIAPRSLESQNGQKEPPTDFTPELASRAMAEVRPVYAAFDCAQKPILDIHGGAHEVDLPALLSFFEENLKASHATHSGLPIPPSPAESASNPTKPMPYRIISFHRGYPNEALPDQGSVSKEIIQRAANLGYNGVQFMFVGETVKDLERFAQYDAKEKTVDFCHRQGMKVTMWVHELSSLPKPGTPGYLGPVALDNEKLWAYLDRRYERILGQLLPNIDGLVLTVVETQIRVTEPKLMTKLALLLRDKCRKYGKELTVRTFVWYPAELEGVRACVNQLPDDVIIMTKCVVQDWQMRGAHDPMIGHVGNHKQIIEYDVAGEYFLLDAVANCMPDVLKGCFDYDRHHGAAGIVVRADRYHSGSEVTDQPQEVNLCALGLWASGKADSVDEVWDRWATQRFGPQAAPGIIRALKPTSQVLTECLNIGPFTFGDTRRASPPNGDADAFAGNWESWRWDESYEPLYCRALEGDPQVIQETERQKAAAFQAARQCLEELNRVETLLAPQDYEILKSRLGNNQVQLEYRAPMMLAYLRYRRMLNARDPGERQRLAKEIHQHLDQIRAVANRTYASLRQIDYRGRQWRVGAPDFVSSRGKPAMDWGVVRAWADKMEALVTSSLDTDAMLDGYYERLSAPHHLDVQTLDAWKQRREVVRQQTLRDIGLDPLPERLPLDPRYGGSLEREDYLLRRVYFQTWPGVYASGWLYLPKTAGKHPAILNPHGHWQNGAMHPVVQSLSIGLVKKGYVALAVDSVHLPVDSFLVGASSIGVMTYNNLRAVDLLETLPQVDATRLGCTGGSGGGQQTMFMMTADPRIKAAVPAVLVSYFRRIMNPAGFPNCRCNIVPGLLRHTDEPEICATFAPQPALFLSTTGDWTKDFPKEEFPEIRSIYALYGQPAAVDSAQWDSPHDYSQPMRERMYAFFNHYLMGKADPAGTAEPPLSPEPLETLKALDQPPLGARKSESIIDWYKTRFSSKPAPLPDAATCEAHRKAVNLRLAAVLGDIEVHGQFASAPQSASQDGFQGQELAVSSEPGIRIAARLLGSKPSAETNLAILIHPGGRNVVLHEYEGLVRSLQTSGVTVLLPDIRLTGTLLRKWSLDEILWGRPEAGMAVTDLHSCLDALRLPAGADTRRVVLVGFGDASLTAVLAGVLEPRITAVIATDLGPTYGEGRSSPLIPNLLRVGDIPQLVAALAPRRAVLASVKPARFEPARNAYHVLQADDALELREGLLTASDLTKTILHELAKPYHQ
jgi:dienelactone hydrolase